MLASATLSPRKTANFVLKLKTRPAHRSPQKTNFHPQSVQNMGRSVSCCSYAVSAPRKSPKRSGQCREGFSVCASRNVCVFARKSGNTMAMRQRQDPFGSEAINFIND